MVDGHYDSIDIRARTKKEAELYSLQRFIAKVKCLDIEAGKPIVIINESDSKEYNISPGQRVGIVYKGKELIGIVDTSESIVSKGEIGLFEEVSRRLGVCTNVKVEVKHLPLPESLKGIMKKIRGFELSDVEIKNFIEDVMEDRISEAEVSAFLVAAEIRGLNSNETVSLTNAMVSSGDSLNLGVKPVVDKHCIGGVAGNRTTMIVVPIMAAAGCYMPKTSSRAITSPAGTADTMEVLAPVEFSLSEVRKLVKKTHGAIVWGGGVNIAPADDKMIKIRRPLHLDPRGVMMASILAKKKAVGSKYLIIDIPVGRGAKIEDIEQGKELGEEFKRVANNLGITAHVIITDGSEPVGNGIGPVLECIDVLKVLEGNGPRDLKHKSLILAGALLELAGKARKGKGYEKAKDILESGMALEKMREIIGAQGGDPDVKPSKLKPGRYYYDVLATRQGRIEHIDNRRISMIARTAGAPFDKEAGVFLFKVKGDVVKKGDKIFRIYASNREKLDIAVRVAEEMPAVLLEKMVLEEIK